MKEVTVERVFKIGIQVIGYLMLTVYAGWQVAIGVGCVSIGTLFASKLMMERKLDGRK